MPVEPETGERQFDYVNPLRRGLQKEMEAAATGHLKRIGAWSGPSSAVPMREDLSG